MSRSCYDSGSKHSKDIKKPTYVFSYRTPPPLRKLPVWHTLCFMRIHGQTQAPAHTICGSVYKWHTVVQGPDHYEHAAATGHSMHFMQQLWFRHQALRRYKKTHLCKMATSKKSGAMAAITSPKASSQALGPALFGIVLLPISGF